MKKIYLICTVFLALQYGCSDPRIDATSMEAMEESAKKIEAQLPEDEKERFRESLASLTAERVIGKAFAMSLQGADDSEIEKSVMESVKDLNGLTAQEIIDKADRTLAERRKREFQQIEREIAELLERKRLASEAEEMLAGFEVQNSSFYFRESSFTTQPIIELWVKNNTGHAVSRVYFEGTLATPGRSVPWLEDDFNYSISGGLEPGEDATWKLAPNQFGEWGRAPKDRKDMVLTVKVTRIDGADGEALYDAMFSNDEIDRLSELQSLLKGKD